MMDLWGNRILAPLTRVTYIIRMGQMNNWSVEAKKKWLNVLIIKCRQTIQEAERELQRLKNGD